MSVVGAIVNRMEVNPQAIETIPTSNIRIPRGEFIDGWIRAEALSDGHTLQGPSAYYLAGAALTCRWLARAMVRTPDGPWEPAPAPATVTAVAHDWNIGDEANAIEAEADDAIRDATGLTPAVAALMGMRDAFAWAWWATGPSPLEPLQQQRGGTPTPD